MMYNFYDTSSILMRATTLFDDPEEKIIISTITLGELEEIKTAYNKTPDIRCAARQVLALLATHKNYETVIFTNAMLMPIIDKDLIINNDTKILASAIWCDTMMHPDEVMFVTNDISLQCIANLFFGSDSITSIKEGIDDEYVGYKEIIMTDEEMAEFYSDLSFNPYGLLVNEYLIVKNTNNEVVDKMRWNGHEFTTISYNTIDSRYFGKVKPYKDDPYQALVVDSFMRNKITLIKGPAGSGKSFLSLSYLFYLLGNNKIDKIIIFCNTVATKGAAKLGYYPGERDEKLLDSQIGNFLTSKLGDKSAAEQLMQQERLILLPMSDIRGYDTSGMRAGVYITEAQNLDISLMKLAIQRIGEDSVCIIDGDQKTQVDDLAFEGSNNGMRRLSKVFRGSALYGEVELKKIHRSQLANLAEKM